MFRPLFETLINISKTIIILSRFFEGITLLKSESLIKCKPDESHRGHIANF